MALRDDVQDAAWRTADDRTEAEGLELLHLLLGDDPAAVWAALKELILESASTSEAEYLYRVAVRVVASTSDQLRSLVRTAASEDDRIASVLYEAFRYDDDQRAFERVMGRQAIVAGWVRYSASKRVDSETFWAWQAVSDANDWPTDDFWGLILDLVDAATDESVISMIGVGPIEDFIGGGWEGAVKRIEAEAPRNARLRQALASAWTSGIPEEFVQRIEAAVARPEWADD